MTPGVYQAWKGVFFELNLMVFDGLGASFEPFRDQNGQVCWCSAGSGSCDSDEDFATNATRP